MVLPRCFVFYVALGGTKNLKEVSAKEEEIQERLFFKNIITGMKNVMEKQAKPNVSLEEMESRERRAGRLCKHCP